MLSSRVSFGVELRMILANVLPDAVRIGYLSSTDDTVLGHVLAPSRVLKQLLKPISQLQLSDIILIQDASLLFPLSRIKPRACLEANVRAEGSAILQNAAAMCTVPCTWHGVPRLDK